MKPRYRIKATIPDSGEDMHLCPICHKETKDGDSSCPKCGYKFPAPDTRHSRLHQDPLIRFPRSADSGTGKESIFL
jgi:predicted amidophosphoribosyltransferase